MRTFGNKIVLALAALCTVPAAKAVAAPLTLTCYNSGTATLSIHALTVYFDTGSSPANSYFSVTTDITNFDSLLYNAFFSKSYDYCTLSSDMRTTPFQIELESLAANISPTGNYAQLTFSYTGLSATYGPPSVNARPATALTAEERSKNLAAFMARVPAPVLSGATVSK